jgi:nitrate/TMAO reductase-like tetraheme cytochrome c subunit
MRFASAILAVIFAGTLWGQKLEPASSAEFCGRCHRAILEAWKTSAHARAMESPIFQEGLEMTAASLGAGSDKLCLNCHAPLAALIQDANLRQKVTWEGITCDYCHSVRTVSQVNGNRKAIVELSLVKTGPLKDVVAPSHGTQFSAVHTSSLICAPCHEYRNSLGFAVLTTYSEWEKSRYAKEGRDCQSCHMYQVAGAVVDPKIKKTPEAKVNLHQMPGSHSIEQLNKTIKAQMSTSREGDRLKVTVQVANVAAGHYVPTGSPMRQLILEVTAAPFGSDAMRQERVYRRTVVDQQDKPVTLEPYAFLRGAKNVTDNRLAPDEKRVETFIFPLKAGVQAQVQATFWYYYSPLARTESQKRVTFLNVRRLVR